MPDVLRADLLVVIGANPVVSHGSVLTVPRIKDRMRDIVKRGARVRLRHDDIATEIAKLSRREAPDGFPMRLIGMREPRSENSWMHNAPLLMRGEHTQNARMHVDDAAAANIVDGDTVRIASEHGEIEVPVIATLDIVAGGSRFPMAGVTKARLAGVWPTARAARTSTH